MSRGDRFRDAPTRVGASIFQTPGGVVAELNQINGDISAFGAELRMCLAANPNATAQHAFYTTVVGPWLARWLAFYEANKGWTDNVWWNHAPEAEQYLTQLTELRAKAKASGFTVQTPEPVKFSPSLLLAPSDNLVDKTAHGAAELAQGLSTAVRVAAFAAIGIGGVALIAYAVKK